MRMLRYAMLPVLLLSTGCGPTGTSGPTPRPYDVIISNGRIVDGTGAAWFYGDIAIRQDRIARIAPRGVLRDAAARQRIDANGMVVAPGFIDIQSHSRGNFLGRGDGRVVSKVTMGITTEIMGEGGTNAIVNVLMAGGDTSAQARTEVQRYGGENGFENWLLDMQTHGASVNFGSFLGATNVRMYAKGAAQGAATAAELDSMRKVVRWAMEDGAFGIASALIYPPATFASTEELIEVSRAMAPYGGVYITHMRSEADQYLEAIDEAVRIGREAGVPVEIYHLKAAGRRNWFKAPLAIAKIDSARAAGIDVQANMYAYIAGGTGLTSCLPPWASEGNKLFDNLANPEMRARIRAEILNPTSQWENLCDLAGPENVLITRFVAQENVPFAGKRLTEIAAAKGKDWIDTALDVILADRRRVETIYFLMNEENVKLQLQQPWMKFGTDAGGFDPDSARGLTHPRAYGNYTRILGKYVRDEGVLPLEDAIRKMSSAVATRLSIQDRGVLKEGMFADIVVFDPRTVADRATFEQPHQLSVGMQHVFVNGQAVVLDGKHTGTLPGRVVRGPGYRLNRK
jgi:N-acyl-D-amino-acid deacylase